MEGLGAEVSAKIRSAIKAKLIELEAYVDEELPDYIMVMVANNRNREQMEDDLGLFLNNNTKAFTNWLHAVLEKLKKVTLEEVTKKDTKKKKVKKTTTSDKSSSKKVSKDEKKSKSEKKPSKSSRSSDKSKISSSKSSANANLEEIGERRRKKLSSHSLDDSGGKGGYDPSSLLKSAVDRSKTKGSPKKSSSKKSSKKDSDDKKMSKNMINLREEEDFYRGKESRHSEGDSRRRGTVSSMVSKVVKPPPRDSRHRHRSRSFSPDGYDPERALKRSMSSRAEVPPRPRRETGREERGGARAVSRAMVDADRSLRGPRDRDMRDVRRYPSPPGHEDRHRERGRYGDPVPRLSPEDIKRYEFLQRRKEERERELSDLSMQDQRQRERDLRDRHRQDEARMRKRERRLEDEDMRLVSSRHIEDDEEDLRVIVRRDEAEMEDITPESSPPKKRRLEDDDAELLEMRRKALESLMKRTDKELLKKEQTAQQPTKERRIVENESDSDSDISEESDTSLSDAEVKEPEPTFIVTMDGIDDNYFKGAAPAKNKEEKPRLKSLARRKAESFVSDSKASSDAELELHADVSFDEPTQKSVKVKEKKAKKQKKEKRVEKKEDVHEKPTMKVAARKRSPILAPANGEATMPVADEKPVQEAPAKSSKGGNAAKLAASYAAKLAKIKAAKAAKQKEEEEETAKEPEPAKETKIEAEPEPTETAPVKKATPVAAPPVKKVIPVAAAVKKTTPAPVVVKAPENKSVSGVKRKPISAPSPDRSLSAVTAPAPTKLSFGDSGASKYKWKAQGGNGAASKYSWKSANRIQY